MKSEYLAQAAFENRAGHSIKNKSVEDDKLLSYQEAQVLPKQQKQGAHFLKCRLMQMDERKGQLAHILLNDEILEVIIPSLIEKIMGPEYEFDVVKATYAHEILEAAAHQSFDLFAFLLNNIIFPKDIMPGRTSSRKALQLVIHLKARYKTPIICLYGYPDDSAYGRQAKLAGADFVFRAPCDAVQLREALEECLGDSSKIKILFVDDEKSILDLLKQTFGDGSDTYSVLTAKDGLIAKEKLEKHAVSLVVTNLNMPGIDGLELLDYIKANYPNIPVIIFSGSHDPEKIQLARDKGAAAYIKKPCMLDDLAKTIRSFLQ